MKAFRSFSKNQRSEFDLYEFLEIHDDYDFGSLCQLTFSDVQFHCFHVHWSFSIDMNFSLCVVLNVAFYVNSTRKAGNQSFYWCYEIP